jgi:ribosomal-protein-serine acetyltransferase
MFSLRVDDEIQIALYEERQAEQVFQVVDQNRAHLREWLGWLDDNLSPEDSRAYIRAVNQKFANNDGFEGGIWYKGEYVGGIGLHYINWLTRKTEIGYWLAASYQGRGIMTRAVRALINEIFNDYNLNRIEIRCATGNLRSCAIPERLGFILEGVQRDGEWLYDHFVDLRVYSLLASQWLTSNKG